MPTIVFDESISVTSGGTAYDGFVIHVWAEQDGNTLSWYAQSITQYFARTRQYYPNYNGGTYRYFDLGCAASYFTLRIGNQSSGEVLASPGTSYGDNGSWNGSWTRTAKTKEPTTTAILTTAPANRYDVYINYRGALGGSVRVQEGLKTSVFTDVDGSIKRCHTVYSKVNNAIKTCSVYTKVNGVIKRIG